MRWGLIAAAALFACERPGPLVAPSPIVEWPATQFVELESIDGRWSKEADEPGYSGTGYLTAPSGESGALRFRIGVASPGSYRVWLRAYEGISDRSVRVTVDGVALESTHGSLDAPGFFWRYAGEVRLEGPEANVAIVDEGSGYQLLDAFVLTSDDAYDPREREARFRTYEEPTARSLALESLVDRVEALESRRTPPSSEEAWWDRAEELRPRVLAALGLDPLPERTPLLAKIRGVVEEEGYRIEKLTFESRPGFLVTALLVIPDGVGPFPAVVRPIGHWGGKERATPLSASIALARAGYVVLTYDPFGQGERGTAGNSHAEHYRLLLTGHSNMSVMVWDTMRAIDYLETRPEVDTLAIAITGASGGGLNTLYATVADPRIAAAIPVVYVSHWSQFLARGHFHDNCNHVPGIVGLANTGALSALFAPRPLAIFSASRDVAFTTEGAALAYEEARAIYSALDAVDRIEHEDFDSEHDYSREMREAAVGFFDRHLLGFGDGSPVAEAPFELPDADELRCFEDGIIPEGESLTVRDLSSDWVEDAIERLLGTGASEQKKELEALVAPHGTDPFEVHEVAVLQVDGVELRKLEVRTATRTIPLLLSVLDPDVPTVLVADPALHTEEHPLFAARRADFNVAYVSLSGHGETASNEHILVTSHIMLGEPIATVRARELELVRQALARHAGLDEVALVALPRGAAFPALLAQATWNGFASVVLGPLPDSYREAFSTSFPISAFVAGILRVADLPRLFEWASERPLLRSSADLEVALEWLQPAR